MSSQVLSVGKHRNGNRIWLQNLQAKGFQPGDLIRVNFHGSAIIVTRDQTSKRKVSAPSKGGVLDLSNKAVTEWVQKHSVATVSVEYTPSQIIITKED